MSVCSCGHRLSSSDRFCPQCGLANTGSPESAGSATLANTATETESFLLTADPETSVETRSEVSSGPSLGWVIAGVVAIVALLGGLFLWPQQEQAVANDDAELAQSTEDPTDQDADQDPDQDDDQDAESGADESDRAAGNRPDPGSETASATNTDSATNGDSGSDTDGGPGDDSAASDRPPVAETGPVVGELTGLGVVIGSYDSLDDVELLSLDTGQTVEFAGVRGIPSGMIGSSLVVSRFGAVSTVDLSSDEFPSTMVLDDDRSNFRESVRVDGSTIWTLVQTEDEYLFERFNLDGTLTETIDLTGATATFPALDRPWVNIVQGFAGGVYRRQGSSFDRLSTGAVLAVGDEIALVVECGDRLQCVRRWHDIDTWAVLDFPTSNDGYHPSSYSTVAGSDRWLYSIDWRSGEVTLTEIETGRIVREWEDGVVFGLGGAPISDDGRWLVDITRFGSSIVDLESGVEWPLDRRFSGDAAPIFINLEDTVFAN